MADSSNRHVGSNAVLPAPWNTSVWIRANWGQENYRADRLADKAIIKNECLIASFKIKNVDTKAVPTGATPRTSHHRSPAGKKRGEKRKENPSKGCDRIFNLKGQDMGSISQTNVGTASKGDSVKKTSEGKSGVTFRPRLQRVLNHTVWIVWTTMYYELPELSELAELSRIDCTGLWLTISLYFLAELD